MRLTINGNIKDLSDAGNIAALVAQFCKSPKNVMAELNGNIIPHSNWDATSLKDGDTIELVGFVGGG